MVRIKLSTNAPQLPLLRQTPGSRGVWGDCVVHVNEAIGECDWWVVYEGLSAEEQTTCPPENTLLLTGEPPAVHTYAPGFLAQFARVLTCQPKLRHAQVIRAQTALPWLAGIRETGTGVCEARLDFDALASMEPAPKEKLLSVVCSNKRISRGHRQRLAFVNQLAAHFGDRLDVFGRGFREVDDKWDAIHPYRYHIVLENCVCPDYFTEKLTDTFLGGAYPIYWGCPNLLRYFPAESYAPIDIRDAPGSIERIEALIAAGTAQKASGAVWSARKLVLEKYNLFAVVADLCASSSGGVPQRISLRPETSFINSSPARRRIARGVRALLSPLARLVRG